MHENEVPIRKNDENEVGFRSKSNLRIDLIGSHLLPFGHSDLVRKAISRFFVAYQRYCSGIDSRAFASINVDVLLTRAFCIFAYF